MKRCAWPEFSARARWAAAEDSYTLHHFLPAGGRLSGAGIAAPCGLVAGAAGSGLICVNGAAARHAQPGDVVILATFAEGVDEAEAKNWKPTVVRVDGSNRILAATPGDEIPGPGRPWVVS